MSDFTTAVVSQTSRTENGMLALRSSSSAVVDFFYSSAASRGKDIIPEFVASYTEDSELTLRIVQWLRDIRGGAGERLLFRQILKYMEYHYPEDAKRLVAKIPEIGRFDDALIFDRPELRKVGFDLVADALRSGNGLAGKWAPRQNLTAVALRNHMGLTPKQYRKLIVGLSNTVEQKMCSQKWDEITYSHVPSLASARYKKAFSRHSPEKYAEYVNALIQKSPDVSVNVSAVFPYDVLKGIINPYGLHRQFSEVELNHIIAQWNALENFIGDANILPLVDVSGSMMCSVGGRKGSDSLTCLDVAVSLGLYCADKNQGKFNGTFLTFSGKPELVHLKGNIVEKVSQMVKSHWEMNTNLHAALDKILQVAKEGNVPAEEMPKMLLIFSDQQYDVCTKFDDSAMEMIRRKFAEAEREVPQIVFWNLNSYSNVPVTAHESGTALVSGFSPAILKAILSTDLSDFSAYNVMIKTVMIPRYDC